jgi:hypothetical protein
MYQSQNLPLSDLHQRLHQLWNLLPPTLPKTTTAVAALVVKSTERKVAVEVAVEASQLKERDAQREISTEEVVPEGYLLFLVLNFI